jgi:hypothetical protein
MYKQMMIGLAACALGTTAIAAHADPHDKGGEGNHGNNGRGNKGQGERGHGNGGDDRGGNDRGSYGYGNDRYAQRYEPPRRDNGNHYGQQKQYYAKGGWQNYHQYDYGHPAPGQTRYYANQYYRSGSYYQPRQLGPGDRIYRGQDNRYYCRRSDGTTGLIIGGLTGGTLGAAISPGGSQTLGALLGGSLGAILGSSIDHGNVTCR